MPSPLEPNDDAVDRSLAHTLTERDPVRERDPALDRAWQCACRHRDSVEAEGKLPESADH